MNWASIGSGLALLFPAVCLAGEAGRLGWVQLDAVISKTGEVEQLKVASGPKELQQSALDAVRQWTYKPFLLNGQPIEVRTTINVNYSLAR